MRRIIYCLIVSIALFLPQSVHAQSSSDWYMAGANPERTSALPQEPTSANFSPIWYRPIEAYIPAHVQAITVGDRVYLSTSKGLLVFNANNGTLLWRFDTQMPLGNSPTVFNNFVYVAGYDRKVYVLSTNQTGPSATPVYTYDLSGYGYDTNPLVISRNNQTWIYLGDRGGIFHAFTFNESTQTGQPRWTYQAGEGIHFSASIYNNLIYFAANDNRAYALNADTGTQVWRSAQLPSYGFFSWWPVIHPASDSLVLARGAMYRYSRGGNPSGQSINGDWDLKIDYNDIWANNTTPPATIGSIIGTDNGKSLIDLTAIRTYHSQKPWRRSIMFLDLNTGLERQFENGYAPFTFTHTKNGNIYPPIVGPDGLIYHSTMYNNDTDSKARVIGWDFTQPTRGRLLSIGNANTEPQALSFAGNRLFRNLNNDRVASSENILSGGQTFYWNYVLADEIGPNYYPMWFLAPNAIVGHTGWYQGNRDFRPEPLEATIQTAPGVYEVRQYDVNTVNAAYHDTGDQNPLVYHNGKFFTIRRNTLIAFGQTSNAGGLPLITANPPQSQAKTLSVPYLTTELQTEIQKILDAGLLRPGYTTVQLGNISELNNYFANPGDTLLTLSMAYPHLSSTQQNAVAQYLNLVYSTYFQNQIVTYTGWAGLAPREAMPLADDLIPYTNNGPTTNPGYPENAYALYQYAKNIPTTNSSTLYQKAKSILPATAPTSFFADDPFTHNRWLTGYYGYINLQALAGYTDAYCQSNPSHTDCVNRNTAKQNLSSLQTLKLQLFNKDSPFISADRYIFYQKPLDIARNFMFLSPELGDWFAANLSAKANEALDEYTTIAPYWFVHHFNAWPAESMLQPLYNSPALFQAKAWIQNQTREELIKYLDAPAFYRGDLFYIQNLVAILNAPGDGGPSPTPQPTPTPSHCLPLGDIDCSGKINSLDYGFIAKYWGTSTYIANLNNSGLVDGADARLLLSSFGQ